MSEVENVKKHYDDNSLIEWNRLEGFHFEFEITKHMLHKHLKKGKILDIGGGPGRYSIYLASLGYDVTLVDLSDENIKLAKEKAKEFNVNLEAYQCDARDLSKLKLDEYDNILIMGPLYHLFGENDREKCVLEAKKHLKKDGRIFVSFISITGGLNYYLDECPEELINETALDLFDRMENDESWFGQAFTDAYFINNLSIVPFFEKLGFEKLTLFGQEGITGTRLSYIQSLNTEIRKMYLQLSLRLCENPQYFSYSSHLMYIGRKSN